MKADLQAAKVYGEALFAAAKDRSAVAGVREESNELLAAFDRVPRFRTLLEAPHIPAEDKSGIVGRVLGGRASDLLKNFVLLLLRKNRIEVLADALAQFRRLADRDQGISQGTLTSATALDQGQRAKLHAALERRTGLKLTIDYKLDPALVGGIVFESGDLMIDNSLRTRLDRLGEKLMAARVN